MKISEAKIKEFQKLYFDCFGITLTKSEAIKQGLALCLLMQSVNTAQFNNENENKYEKPVSAKD